MIALRDQLLPVRSIRRGLYATDDNDVADDGDVERAQKRVRDRTQRDPHRRLSRAGPLDRRIGIVKTVLQHTSQIRMPGPGYRSRRLPIIRDPAPVADRQAYRCTGRLAFPNAGDDAHSIAFDVHPSAAPDTPLTPPQVTIDVVGRERESCRNAFQDPDQLLAVRFTGGHVPQHRGARSACVADRKLLA